MTVIIAFCANVLVAIAKSIAAFITGSASMVAEAAHSWADAGNEVFLIIADKRSARPKDPRHPLGYGREAYVWSLFAAVGIFTAGAVVSVMHGVQELTNPAPVESPLIAYIVLAIAFVLEGISFTQALIQVRRRARETQTSAANIVLNSSDTTLRAVFAEDSAALAGLILAAAGIAVHQITGDAVWDAVGSIAIGVLLGIIALFLIDRNRHFLVGATSSRDLRRRVGQSLLQHPDIERLTYLHLEFIGPRRLFLVAEVDLAGNDNEEQVAVELRRIEREIESHDEIETAVLSLSVSDEASLEF
ncbi:cation diffusion facilitator family transporter [Paramicrobacterium humi]|uniref:Cation diffusion facilitator family transporter n=1 Tax=Paramicrobacterium humi TaxID=640635 RepID=A0A1H4KNN0_9MICO|nr:cation diffusion facilitator family transporter [Microbacterium humi]SEB60087.1 cation diffusion facilitator family transporter [Microbacterium humi]